jgi:hypothetical protein
LSHHAIFERDAGNQGLEISVDTCGHRGRSEIRAWERTIGFYPALIPLRQLLNFFTHYIPLGNNNNSAQCGQCGAVTAQKKLYALITISSWEKRRRPWLERFYEIKLTKPNIILLGCSGAQMEFSYLPDKSYWNPLTHQNLIIS